MAKAKFSLSKQSNLQQIQSVTDLKTGMTGNANFTTPVPSLAAGALIIANAQAAVTASDAAQQAAILATANKVAAMLALADLGTQWVSYMEFTAAGDAVKLMSGGLALRAPYTPVAVPGPLDNLSIAAGDHAGGLDLQWDPDDTANHYEAQLCAVMDFSTGIIPLPGVTKSKTSAFGLTSGTRMFARVRAVNAAGAGAWSGVASKIAP